jgi:stearoyl-CoA desaturase (delta-9 desaturase)
MSALHRWLNLAGVLLPFLGFVVAVVLLWNTLVDWSDLAVMAIMYVISGYGVTLGFHRLLTHRSFQTFKPVEHTDKEGDPHSPHGHGTGLRGAIFGLWYAHMGWLFLASGTSEHSRYARDLYEDRGMRFIHRTFGLWVISGLLLPAAIGYVLEPTLAGAAKAALWGGPVRIFALHHVTWSINSVCHFFGSRRFDVDDHSTNVFWLALLSFGESWHHNHHAFPRSARHGLRWWEIDPTAWLIRGMRRARLAWNVVEITPERQQQKLA